MPDETPYLVTARGVLNPAELKFLVGSIPEETSVPVLVAFSRWRVDRCFEDQKSDVGLGQY